MKVWRITIFKTIIKKLVPVEVFESYFYYLRLREQRRITRRNEEVVRRLVTGGAPVKLELGAGVNREIEGWIYADNNKNCDLNLDLTEPLPFPDDSVDEIYSSHLLEHFNYKQLMNLLAECRRILKPAGFISAAVPNARMYINAYMHPERFEPSEFCRHKPVFNYDSKIDYINYIAYMGGHHRYMFDEENVTAIFSKAGFRDARLRAFDGKLDMSERDFESIYIVARK